MKEYLTRDELIELLQNSDRSSKYKIEKISNYYSDGYTYQVNVGIDFKTKPTYEDRWWYTDGWPSGLRRGTGNAVGVSKRPVGSNPTPSAIK